MTEPGDPVARRYRELAREEPGASLDDAILAASRRAAGARPGGKRTGAARWMGPVSIAAVLVLGIGVSLRMQLEKPGIETSMPTQSSGEYPVPPSAEAPPPPQAKPATVEEQKLARKDPAAPERGAAARADAAAPMPAKKKADAQVAETAKPLAKRIEVPAQPAEAEAMRNRAEPNPFTDAPVVMQQAPGPAAPPSVAMTAPAASPPPPAPAPASRAASPAVVAEARAPAAAGAPAPAAAPEPQAQLRAKREGFAADAARESRAIGSLADPDPTRELERIARLREAGRHADADRALEEFRRRHPDYRIPEAVWERVRPR